MPDPDAGLNWSNLEARLAQILQMPHNAGMLKGQAPQQKAKQMAQDIARGFVGAPETVEFVGPKRFLRATGPANAAYSGSWWFPEEVLLRPENELSRVPLPGEHLRTMLQRRLRERMAVPMDWNDMTELWVLSLPPGERLSGLVGKTAYQPVYFSPKHPQHDPIWILPGDEIQIYFPVFNPLWVSRYR